MKGIIALDIDGTVTDQMTHVLPRVVDYLHELQRERYALIFITGRNFNWAHQSLHELDFPYTLALQNGALLLEMPSRKIVLKRYLDKNILPMMDQACLGEPTDYVIFSGYDNGDLCYYRPEKFAPDLLAYALERGRRLKETWIDTPDFGNIGIDEFASVKGFGALESLKRIGEKIESTLQLHAPLVKDPMREGYYVLQATHPLVNKGEALKAFAQLYDPKAPIIAAGDDDNDRSMLACADIKVVMSTAHEGLLQEADVIAPPASQGGLVEGLTEAIAKCQR